MYGHGGIIPPFRVDMMLMLMLVLMAEGVCTWEHETTCRLPVPVLCRNTNRCPAHVHKDNMKITHEMI